MCASVGGKKKRLDIFSIAMAEDVMYKENKIKPRMDPWETPAVRLWDSETDPCQVTW